MFARTMFTIALFVSMTVVSAASAETTGEWAQKVQATLQDRLMPVCNATNSPEKCADDFQRAELISWLLQEKYMKLVAYAISNDPSVTIARLDVQAYRALLEGDLKRITQKYGRIQ